MIGYKKLVILLLMLMLLVAGASAIKFVINDGDAAVSLAATDNGDVAVSIVAAENPASFSADMSADDSSGASASQDSSVVGADSAISVSAGISSDGDSAYTVNELCQGTTVTTQNAQASQGNSASASQNTMSVGVAGNSVSNATDSEGNTAFEANAFLLGISVANLSASTHNSATASQGGTFSGVVGLAASTLGLAKSTSGGGYNISYTSANVTVGGMTFDNTATAHGVTTEASQDVLLAGLAGDATFGSRSIVDTQTGGAGIIGGTLAVTQQTNTSGSAHGTQSGSLNALLGTTWDTTASTWGQTSWTKADIFTGTMTFSNTGDAGPYTSADQTVNMAGIAANASFGSIGGMDTENGGAGILGGTLDVTQNANTGYGSVHGSQSGTMSALYGTTWGNATTDTEYSKTAADIVAGSMTFNNSLTADGNTSAGQTVQIPFAVSGDAVAQSYDGTNFTHEAAGISIGTMYVTQQTDTRGSAHTTQTGSMTAVFGNTFGIALTSGNEYSKTAADMVAGTMTFDNGATADGNTAAGQTVQMPFAVSGNMTAESFDGTNYTHEAAGMSIGAMDVRQVTDTSGSAHSIQSGIITAALGSTSGLASTLTASGPEYSKTAADMVVGSMTFYNSMTADGHTQASQTVQIPFAVSGNAMAESFDGTNYTHEAAGMSIGTMNVTQQANTSASAHATQSGSITAAFGNTSGYASTMATGEYSKTAADVVIGSMTFDNSMTADGHTQAGQTIQIPLAVSGKATAESWDGTNYTHEAAGMSIGTMNVTQQANTSASVHATQSGSITAAFGNTSGYASTMATGEYSQTAADVVIGSMTFDNSMTADGHTQAGQTVQIPLAVSGNAMAESFDGTNYTHEAAGMSIGTMNVTQQANTSASAHATQSGSITAAYGNISELARSGGDLSWTKANVTVGTLTFDSNANADGNTSVGQHVNVTGLAGSASVGSTDQDGNIAMVGTSFVIGSLDMNQLTNTTSSAEASQSGTVWGLTGNTLGNATNSIGDQSWTSSNVSVGVITQTNNFVHAGNSNTTAGQDVNVTGLAGSAAVGSTDEISNTGTVGTSFLVGSLDMNQLTNTTASADASQSGTVWGLTGHTWGNATVSFDGDQSWTSSDVSVGIITQTNNFVHAGATTSTAGQNVNVTGLAGSASVGSVEEGVKVGTVGTSFVIGSLNMNQLTNTTSSAEASQSGTVWGLTGNTWGNATASDGDQSWTSSNVSIGLITQTNNFVHASDITTAAGQSVNITGVNGSASVGSTDGLSSAEVGTMITNGVPLTSYINMNQQTSTTGSALANQSGSVIALLGNGSTWGNAVSGANQSWTSANVTTGLLTMTNNTVIAGGSTSARQQLNIAALGGDASSGSTDGLNSVEVGGQFTTGNLNLNQVTNTGGSAFANQSGSITALTGMTWGEARSGNNLSFTNANVTNGIITMNANPVTAAGSTIASQGLSITGTSGRAAVGSNDGTNWVYMGATINNGVLFTSSINMKQQTSTTGSALANQSGSVVALVGNGDTYSEATSGGNQSSTSANVTTGTITITSNKVYAGSITNGSQKVGITGYSGNAWIGSINDMNTARVGAGFNGNSIPTGGSLINMNQMTNTTASANANQTGTVGSFNTIFNAAWTQTQATNISDNRQAVVVTLAQGPVTITTNSNAYSSLANVTAYEQKSKLGGSSSTSSFARNSTTTMGPIYSSSGTTKGLAYANLTGINTQFV